MPNKFTDTIKEIKDELIHPVPCQDCKGTGKKTTATCSSPPKITELAIIIKEHLNNKGTLKELFIFNPFSKEVSKKQKCSGFHRPYFTMWVILVDILVLVSALCSYNFAPLGTSYKPIKKPLLRHNLAYETVVYMQQENFWIGPDYADLIHFGAKYSPCMRHDSAMKEMVHYDWTVEDGTGCCVREDLNVCWQAAEKNCTSAFSRFYEKKVCGMGRELCDDTVAEKNNDTVWAGPITKWPNCMVTNRTVLDESKYPTLACEVTARPCCIGLQGQCAILSEEECAYRNGYFHEDKSLCAQVHCIENVCGVDVSGTYQWYRFVIPTFIHSGVLHLLLSVVCLYGILRPYEASNGWWRTVIVYFSSACGGTLISAVFAPYQPKVGASGSLFGIIGAHIARDMVEIGDWSVKTGKMKHPTGKMFGWLLLCCFLLMTGLVPWIDNWAHVGGLLYGFLTAIVIHKRYCQDCQNRSGDKVIRATVRIIVFCCLVLITVLFLYLFYIKQDLEVHLDGFNCLPLTPEWCQDSWMDLKPRIPT